MHDFRPYSLVLLGAMSLLAGCGGDSGGEAPAATPEPVPPLAATNPDQTCANLARAFSLQGHKVDEGPGPDQLGMLDDQMVEWVEKSVAPTSVLGTRRVNNVVDRTMPICAYHAGGALQGNRQGEGRHQLAVRGSVTNAREARCSFI